MAKGELEYRSLGRCGTKVSAFGLGAWTTFGDSVNDRKTISRILDAAVEAGINFFDVADAYAKGQAERIVGEALAQYPRHELVISSKVFFAMSDDVNDRGLSRKHIMESVHGSLQRLGTDYLDIYFCHRFDKYTPVEETARAMDDLVHQGKIVYWGTSEWTGAQLHELHTYCNEHNLYRPQVEQPQYSLLARAKFEQDVRPAAVEYGMGLVVWSPLAFGLLTGKYDEGLPKDARLARLDWLREEAYTDERLERVRTFKAIADELGCSRARLALAWAAAQTDVSSVILGVTRLEQLHENLGALGVEITPDLLDRLDAVFPGDSRVLS